MESELKRLQLMSTKVKMAWDEFKEETTKSDKLHLPQSLHNEIVELRPIAKRKTELMTDIHKILFGGLDEKSTKEHIEKLFRKTWIQVTFE